MPNATQSLSFFCHPILPDFAPQRGFAPLEVKELLRVPVLDTVFRTGGNDISQLTSLTVPGKAVIISAF